MSTARLAQVIRENVRELSGELRVCLPAKIARYDTATHLASVQPLLKRRFYGRKDAVDMPEIHNVPVVHPRTASAMIRLPVTVGDIVMLVFSDRSLEQWIAGDGTSKDPLDPRQHHLSDAYAVLGGYPRGKKVAAKNPKALEIEVAPGTKLTIGNGTDELLALAFQAFGDLKNLCDELSGTLAQVQLLTVAGVTPGGGVSGLPVNAAAFAAIKATVDGISTDVDTVTASLANIKL